MSSALFAGAASPEKAMGLFLAILDNPAVPLSRLAAQSGLSASTSHRLIGVLVRQGLLSRTGAGRYGPGLRLARLAGRTDTRGVLVAVARPILLRLGASLGTTVHLGVLEGDMVTYLVKAHGGGTGLRTREAIQLEAYCTGIGKVLLAALDDAARALYLAAGPFIRLTPATITHPAALRAHLAHVGRQGFATDAAEFEDGLHCLAVPVRGPGGGVVAALSASSFAGPCAESWLSKLRHAAARIGRNLGAPP